MTKQEWLACADPQTMLEFLGDKSSERKYRLFAFACLRRVWHVLSCAQATRVIEVAERRLEHQAGDEAVQAAEAEFYEKAHAWEMHSLILALYAAVAKTGSFRLAARVAKWARAAANNDVLVEREAQIRLVHDIFGHTFYPVPLNALSVTRNVVALSQEIYDGRAFDRLPILADALEDPGCTDPYVLDHCRGQALHVRGCWVVDLILSKDR